MERKVDAIDDKIVGGFKMLQAFGNATLGSNFDSSDSEPEEESAAGSKMDLKVTIVRATGLNEESAWGKSYVFCSFVVRGRRNCGWKQTQHVKKSDKVEWNTDGVLKGVRLGDCLKFKVWVTDGVALEDLLGRARGVNSGGILMTSGMIGRLTLDGLLGRKEEITLKLKGEHLKKSAALTVRIEKAEVMTDHANVKTRYPDDADGQANRPKGRCC